MYCIDVLEGSSKKNLLSILKLQTRAIRLITSSPYRSESAPLFQSLQILSVLRVHVFKLSVLMVKFVNGDVIESIKDMFSINKEIHDHFTRQSNKLHVPRCNKTITQTNVRFRGVKIWNYICDVVYFHCSLSCFKCNLKALGVVTWLRPCIRLRIVQSLRPRHNPACLWSPQCTGNHS